MYRWFQILLVTILLSVSAISCSRSPSTDTDVNGLIKEAMNTLGAQQGDPNLCVLTDATYVNLGGKSSAQYMGVIEEQTGCSMAKGNLLLFHRPSNYDLIVAVYKGDTKECVIIKYNGQKGRSGKLDLSDKEMSRPDFWQRAKKGVGGPDTFGIVTILGAWSLGAPYDYLKCAEFHGHICPGITWGYFTAKAIQRQYPLSLGEKYVFIASPNACKDDAIQVLLDVTPGKKTLIVKQLTEEQERQVPTGKKAGILVKWNESKKKGKGVVLVLDMGKIRKTVDFEKPSKDQAKATLVSKLIPLLNSSEGFVKVIQEFDVTPEILEGLTSAGKNPYEVIRLKEWLTR